MADDGDHLVVVVGAERDDLGAELGDDGGDGGERGVGGHRLRRQHPHGALEEVGVGAVEAVELAAGHRVAADEAAVVDRRADRALDAADVGDDAGGLGERPLDLVGHGQHRHGHERELAARVDAGGVDARPAAGRVDAIGVDVVAGHVPARLAQGEGDRPADQAEADHGGAAAGGLVHGRERTGEVLGDLATARRRPRSVPRRSPWPGR